MNNSASYIAGVAKVLAKKPTIKTGMSFYGIKKYGVDTLIDEEHMEGEFLLTAVANCPYCGGGFKGLPAAAPTDGFLDVLVVKNISRARFMTVVGAYRAGTHVNMETWTPAPQFASILEYRRCKAFTLDTVNRICLDGEILPACGVRAEVIPGALRYVPLKFLEKNT
jgi:diacylglycerol kinase family enzyme